MIGKLLCLLLDHPEGRAFTLLRHGSEEVAYAACMRCGTTLTEYQPKDKGDEQ
jgi:hypothetical protein